MKDISIRDIKAHLENEEIHGRKVESNNYVAKLYLYESLYDNGDSGDAKEIDWNNGGKQQITTTDSCTLTFVDPPLPCNLQLKIIHEDSSSSYTYTFPENVYVPDGYNFVATAAESGAIDILSLFYDGTDYFVLGNNKFIAIV